MRIDTGGNVGIGATPSAWVSSWKAIDLVTGGGSFFGSLAIAGMGNNAYLDSGVNWRYKDSYGAAQVYFASTGSISLNTAAAGTAGNVVPFVTRLYVAPGGDVGIGTESPGSRLHVNGGSGLIVGDTGLSSSQVNIGIALLTAGRPFIGTNTNTNALEVGTRANSPLIFVANSSEWMRVTAAGDVGIGTGSPNTKLEVAGNIRTAGEVALSGADFVYSFAGGSSGQRRSGLYLDGSNNELRFYTSNAEIARFNSSGSLGIGATSVSVKLHVAANNPTRGILHLIRNDGSSGQTGSQIQISQNAIADWAIGQPAGTSAFAIWVDRNTATDGTELFRLSSSGALTSTNLADAVGYKGLPQNSQTTGYTLALSDMGKHISITTGNITIPANGSVAFPVGAAVTIYNNSGSTQTIAITTDTLRQAGTTNTGTRTLAAYGVATVLKVASTTWVISGNVT
jgi:hypothetical protein